MIPLLAQTVASAPWWVTPLGAVASAIAMAVGWLWKDERAARRAAEDKLTACYAHHAAQLVTLNDARLSDRASCESARIAEHQRHHAEMRELLEDAVTRGEAVDATLARMEASLKGKKPSP